MLKKLVAMVLSMSLIGITALSIFAAEQKQAPIKQQETKLDLPVKSAILMEQKTGKILYTSNADEKMPPASITKIMTLLLVMEEIQAGNIKYTDMVTCSEHANSMGGTQIWLEVNEQMSVEDLLKAACVNSANDASVALGEHISGSEETFVDLMNRRAKQLGMNNTTFKNATGLDAEGHLTTAHDIALMSRELLNHRDITKYTTIWMDSLRGGKTGLVNTNKLVRFYEGCTGLKTGTTDGAGCCVSATAKRGDMELIAVVMGAANGDDRFSAARKLLDYGFANYQTYASKKNQKFAPIAVRKGVSNQVKVAADADYSAVIPKGKESEIEEKIVISESVQAPVEKGQTVGKITVSLSGEKLCEIPIKTTENVKKRGFLSSFKMLLEIMFGK